MGYVVEMNTSEAPTKLRPERCIGLQAINAPKGGTNGRKTQRRTAPIKRSLGSTEHATAKGGTLGESCTSLGHKHTLGIGESPSRAGRHQLSNARKTNANTIFLVSAVSAGYRTRRRGPIDQPEGNMQQPGVPAPMSTSLSEAGNLTAYSQLSSRHLGKHKLTDITPTADPTIFTTRS